MSRLTSMMIDFIANRVGLRAGQIIEAELPVQKQRYRQYLAAEPTGSLGKRRIDSLMPTQTELPAFLRTPLPVDADGCLFVRSGTSDKLIGDLIVEMADIFRRATGSYPAVIELCPEQWIYGDTYGSYTPRDGVPIPFVRGHNDKCQVCCKSLPMRR